MSELNNINQWICKCGASNSVRKRYCVNCQKKMPRSFMNEVYKSEVKRLKGYILLQEEISLRKFGETFVKLKMATIILSLIAIVGCNFIRFHYFPSTVHELENHLIEKEERLDLKTETIGEHLNGLQELPNIIGVSFRKISEKVEDVVEGTPGKHILNIVYLKEDKPNHIGDKLMEVKNYVTGIFR